MTRKGLISMLFGIFVMAMAMAMTGPASAEEPVVVLASSAYGGNQSAAEPGPAVGQGETWQEREALETGALPAMPGESPGLRCCETSVDSEGSTGIRPGIDAGP